jgi:hypothetical protein
VEVRDTQGAEKVLLTAIAGGASSEMLADMMLIAATDHFYLDGGHTFDFHNKAFEILEHMEPGSEDQVLASLVPLLRSPARSEELHHWQAPLDLVTPIRQAVERLEAAKPAESREEALDEQALVEQLLSDRPLETIERLTELLLAGVQPSRLAQLVAAAAAERIVHFHTQNDFGDWIAAYVYLCACGARTAASFEGAAAQPCAVPLRDRRVS